MDFLEVIEKRHSVRKYSDKPVDREILDAIVRVARQRRHQGTARVRHL